MILVDTFGLVLKEEGKMKFEKKRRLLAGSDGGEEKDDKTRFSEIEG